MGLTPLPQFENEIPETVVFWNIETGELQGQGVDWVRPLIEEAKRQGSLTSSKGEVVQIDDPLKSSTQLSMILSQRYWVSPQPVEAPEDPQSGSLQ
ncbi:hypothetical protein SAMN05443662_1149 [Sulfurivirga caldicuralii]|uniref:Uncharacterized protein n=2 Tax=Sulfurivirga caldicuralii TaxID=364032 RepID=A0A1N6G172_9GAMM|nr:hypothetical protein SAMN05443662_1149 [Sulfurivirga caldicuralii]